MGFCNIHRRLQNENYYQSSMIHRVDTNASTHPMMSNFEVNPPNQHLFEMQSTSSSFEMKSFLASINKEAIKLTVHFLPLQEKVGFQMEVKLYNVHIF